MKLMPAVAAWGILVTPCPGRGERWRGHEPLHPHSQPAGAAQLHHALAAGWKPALLSCSPIPACNVSTPRVEFATRGRPYCSTNT